MASKTTPDLKYKVRLILYDRGKILLLKQRRGNGGNYTLVGGTVEFNEYAKEALIRETFEESNIKIDPADLTLAHVLHKRTKSGHRVNMYFKASRYKGSLMNVEDHKFKAVQWFPINKLPENVTDTVRQALESYKAGILYSQQTKK